MAKKKNRTGMTDEQYEQLAQTFAEEIEKQFKRGVAEGAYATMMLVRTHLKNENLAPEQCIEKLRTLADQYFSSEVGKALLKKHAERENHNGKAE